jgi:hypothetical protein
MSFPGYLQSNIPPPQQAPFTTHLAYALTNGQVITLAQVARALPGHAGPFLITGYDLYNQSSATVLFQLLGSAADSISTLQVIPCPPNTVMGDDVELYGFAVSSVPSVTPGQPIVFLRVRGQS